MQEDLDLDHMPFIKNWINIEKVGPDLKQKLIEKIGKTYDLMMTNTIVLTNSVL